MTETAEKGPSLTLFMIAQTFFFLSSENLGTEKDL